MNTLLILGSKPNPSLPPRNEYNDLACANASGFSAKMYGLPTPAYTIMSSSAFWRMNIMLEEVMRALSGLKTDRLYFYPRPKKSGFRWIKHPIKWMFYPPMECRPFYVRRLLKSISYEYKDFIYKDRSYYLGLAAELCDHNSEVVPLIRKKGPSTGIHTLIIGMSLNKYDRFIMSGFSLSNTYPYGIYPGIKERGTALNGHVTTDVAVLNYLCKKNGNIFTTESALNELAGVPLLNESQIEK